MLDKIKELHPKERLKKLKELKEKHLKEIKETEKSIVESEQEITKEQVFKEKITIPELSAESLEGLSEEAKQMIKEIRGKTEKRLELEESVLKKYNIPESLEDTLEDQLSGKELNQINIDYHPNSENIQYAQHLSTRPVYQLHKEVEEVEQRFAEKGYLSMEDQHILQTRREALDKKIEAVNKGQYSWGENLEESAFNALHTSEKLLERTYHSHNKIERKYNPN